MSINFLSVESIDKMASMYKLRLLLCNGCVYAWLCRLFAYGSVQARDPPPSREGSTGLTKFHVNLTAMCQQKQVKFVLVQACWDKNELL